MGCLAPDGGEALIRLHPGPVFSGLTNDYWAPTNWMTLDSNDTDIGSSGALLVDVPGATPFQFVAALGKDGNAYLANRTNLGGVKVAVAQAHVSSTAIKVAPVTYRTSLGTYIVCCDDNDFNNNLISFRISAASPPGISTVWTVSQHGHGSPFVTSTDGTNNFIVWGIGSQGTQRLYAFNADTGATIYSGGGSNELMSGTHRFNTGIVARGRIFLANDNRVYAFTVPVAPSIVAQPTNETVAAGATASFSVVASGSAPLSCQWVFNATNRLTGATTNILNLPNVQATNAGSYSVVITNSIGSVTSAPAVLMVLVPPILLTNSTVLPGGAFQFSFTNVSGLTFTVFGSTNMTLPFTNWTVLGAATEGFPGQFQFADPQATNYPERFYRARSP